MCGTILTNNTERDYMNTFKKKSLITRMKISLPELEAYHRDQREYQYECNTAITGIRWRKLIHPILLVGLAVGRAISKDRLHIVQDLHTYSEKPVIFACTHIGWKDAYMNFAAVKTHAYLFLGDPRDLYRRVEGLLLHLNGVICVDTDQKRDRFIGKETCVRLLESGGNLLIYPEGAWNVTENQVVMPLFPGTAEIAIRTGAEIVPVAAEQYGKHYYVNIGRNIRTNELNLSQKKQLTDELRDTLCTLKWEIWERFGADSRKNISDDYSKTFLASLEAQMNDVYSLEDIYTTRYHQKVTSPQEAFTHLEHLIPCRENAFLFRK